mgnify:CR=1 FL=1
MAICSRHGWMSKEEENNKNDLIECPGHLTQSIPSELYKPKLLKPTVNKVIMNKLQRCFDLTLYRNMIVNTSAVIYIWKRNKPWVT